VITATVSGSFRRHMQEIAAAVDELIALSVRVLSPADPRVVANQGEFLFVASDPVRSVRLVQDRHLESIRAADFLWLVCPDGYVGQSASMEIGYAAATGIPIFATRAPEDLTLRQYVSVRSSLAEVVRAIAAGPRRSRPAGLLIDPHASVEEAHDILERLEKALTRGSSHDDPARSVQLEMAKLQTALRLPTFQ
jgi:nucleoside 2-deoxyribosyltransferase